MRSESARVAQPIARKAHSLPAAGPWALRLATFAVALGLLGYALRGLDVGDTWSALRLLAPWQILAVLGVDALIHGLSGVRWWMIIRGDRPRARLIPVIAARLAAFGVSYFTVGPQIGGEPLQVLYLRRQHGVALSRAAATVLLDKLLELLANYLLLLVAAAALFESGLLGVGRAPGTLLLGALLVLGSWPVIHIWMLRRGSHPIASFLGWVLARDGTSRWIRHIRISEKVAGRFCCRRPFRLAAAGLASLSAGLLAVIEYALIASFLNTGLSLWQSVSGWGTAWLSFLLPLPGGAGALEAGQVLALGRFGVSAELAIAFTVLLRGRDILFGGSGLFFAARYVQRQ
jgi:uncharacterized membrane protein YbhN (UPF0104 family)